MRKKVTTDAPKGDLFYVDIEVAGVADGAGRTRVRVSFQVWGRCGKGGGSGGGREKIGGRKRCRQHQLHAHMLFQVWMAVEGWCGRQLAHGRAGVWPELQGQPGRRRAHVAPGVDRCGQVWTCRGRAHGRACVGAGVDRCGQVWTGRGRAHGRVCVAPGVQKSGEGAWAPAVGIPA
eukprot:356833-Chlamydomonas_euryale.AAC.2